MRTAPPEAPMDAPDGAPAAGPSSGSVPLPKGYTGIRSWRRERQRRQRRQRRIAFAGIFVVVVVAALLVGMVGTVGNKPGPSKPAAPAHAAAPASVLPLLLVQKDASGQAETIYLLAPLPSQRGGSVLLIPPGTVTQVVPGGSQPIQTALFNTPGVTSSTATDASGKAKLMATVENMLGIQVGGVSALNDAQLTAAVAPAGPLVITLPVAVVPRAGTFGAGFPAGPNVIQPDQVPVFLATQDSAGEPDRLDRMSLVLNAWIGKIRSDPQAVPPGDDALDATLSMLAKGAVVIQDLPVTNIGQANDGTALFQVSQKDLATMLPGIVPGQPAATQPRAKVQLLNGTGGLGVDERAMSHIVPAVDVLLSGNADNFAYPRTQIIYYDDAGKAVAQRLVSLLGVGEILQSTHPSGIVDVTVIVGADFHG